MAIRSVSRSGHSDRIGNSIKGFIFGLVLLAASLAVFVINERNAIRDIRANQEIASHVISIGNEQALPANEGKLVHLNGTAETTDLLSNGRFGIEENAIRISWDARIYQWVEEKNTKTKKTTGGRPS